MSVRDGIPGMGVPLNDLLEQLRAKPSHGSEVIKEAAQILLVHLCNFLQNFPCKEGIEIMSSQITEEDDIETEPKPLYFIYNDFALFSFVEVCFILPFFLIINHQNSRKKYIFNILNHLLNNTMNVFIF
jgi:hypothetical protein